MRDRRQIRALFDAGVRPALIATVVGCSRSSVYRALEPGAALEYRRPRLSDRYGQRIDELLAAFPRMDSVAIARQSGWAGSLRQLEREVSRRRPAALAAAGDVVLRTAKTWGVNHGSSDS